MKFQLIILSVVRFIILGVEFIWHTGFVVVEAIGNKITELADVTEAAYQKWKRVNRLKRRKH